MKDGKIYIAGHYYSDAALASRFNGRKFHPVIWRPAFMPSYYRNSFGYGGGILMGYMCAVSSLQCFYSLVLLHY